MISYSESLHEGGELTITVRSVTAQNDGSEVALRILLSEGEHREERRLVLMTQQYLDLKPSKGEIDEALFEALESAAELCRAVRAGENLLSYGGNTARMLTQKLMRKGFMRNVATEAAEYLSCMGLIDELRDMQRELEKCLRKQWGAKRISTHLWSRGFEAETMQQLPALLEEIDFTQNCEALIRKHYGVAPRDPDEQRKMIASLSRYGYTLGEIREAMKRSAQ